MTARAPWIAIWLMTASPLVFLPGAMTRFVFPKLLLVALAIAVGALVVRGGRLPRGVALPAAAGAAIFVAAALTSSTPLASLLGRWPRYEGLPVLAIYFGAAWLGARLFNGPERADRGRQLMRATAVMTLVLATFSVLEAVGWSVTGASDLSRTGSVLGNATDQGLVAMMAAALLVGPAFTTPSVLWVTGLCSALATVALSGSRAAMLATVLVLLVHLVVARRGDMTRQTVAGLTGLVALALAVPQARDRLTNIDTVTSRGVLWEATGHLAADHVLLGAGPSRFVDAIGPYENSSWIDRAGIDLAPDSPHGWPLQALSAGGLLLLVPALVLAVSIVVLGVRRARRHPDDTLTVGLLAATLGYGSAVLVNFTIAGSTCFAAFLVGALVSRPASFAQSSSSRLRGVAAAAGLIAVAGTLMASVAEIELQHGVEAAARGDVRTADASFERASRWRPLDSDVAMIAAKALAGPASSGDQDAAAATERWAVRSLDRTPDTYDSGLALAVARLADDDLTGARTVLDDLVTRFPVTQAAYVQRGIVRFGQRDVEGARDDLARAQVLDPDDPAPAAILAEIERRLS